MKFLTVLFSLSATAVVSSGFYPLCGYGDSSTPCVLQPSNADGLMLALPFTQAAEGVFNDWQPMNCQYNGQQHLKPVGISSTDGSTAICNPNYFYFEHVPDFSGDIALRGNMFAGDFAKDNSDLAQQGSGAKCPTTRVASASNSNGEYTLVMPQGYLYTEVFSMMITEAHTGFLFSIHEIQGCNVRIVFLDSTSPGVTTAGFYLAIVSPINEDAPITGSALGPMIYAVTAYDLTFGVAKLQWFDWQVQYCAGCKSIGAGYVQATLSINGNKVGDSGIWTLTKAPDGYNIKYGVTTISPNCATSDFTFFLRNVLIYRASVIPSSAPNDLASYSTPLPKYTGTTLPTSYDASMFAVFPTLPTVEADSKTGFNPPTGNIAPTSTFITGTSTSTSTFTASTSTSSSTSNAATSTSTSTTSTPKLTTTTASSCTPSPYFCGATFDTISCSPAITCPSGLDGECPTGQKCFANTPCPTITCSTTKASTTSTSTSTSTTSTPKLTTTTSLPSSSSTTITATAAKTTTTTLPSSSSSSSTTTTPKITTSTSTTTAPKTITSSTTTTPKTTTKTTTKSTTTTTKKSTTTAGSSSVTTTNCIGNYPLDQGFVCQWDCQCSGSSGGCLFNAAGTLTCSSGSSGVSCKTYKDCSGSLTCVSNICQ